MTRIVLGDEILGNGQSVSVCDVAKQSVGGYVSVAILYRLDCWGASETHLLITPSLAILAWTRGDSLVKTFVRQSLSSQVPGVAPCHVSMLLHGDRRTKLDNGTILPFLT